MDHTEVKVVTLPMEQWVKDYYRPQQFAEACRACPNYGRVWSCPPLMDTVPNLLKPFTRVHLVGVKVVYRQETIDKTITLAQADEVRRRTYDPVKRTLLESLLQVEKVLPGSWSLAAGECRICKQCARLEGLPCRHPEMLRCSFSGFGFDLMRIARELFGYELLWSPKGLPSYNVAFGCFLERQDKLLEQDFTVKDARPWALLREQILGVLRQMGCQVEERRENGCQEVYFDTRDGRLLDRNSAFSLSTDPLRLNWQETSPNGTLQPGMSTLDTFAGDAIGEFLRSHLSELGAVQLLPTLETGEERHSFTLRDGATGDRYEVIFSGIRYGSMTEDRTARENRVKLRCLSGSGRRLDRFSNSLLTRFPELEITPESPYSRGYTLLKNKTQVK